MFADTQGCRVLAAEFPARLSLTNIRVGVANGRGTQRGVLSERAAA